MKLIPANGIAANAADSVQDRLLPVPWCQAVLQLVLSRYVICDTSCQQLNSPIAQSVLVSLSGNAALHERIPIGRITSIPTAIFIVITFFSATKTKFRGKVLAKWKSVVKMYNVH
jgi:hypothetical protein